MALTAKQERFAQNIGMKGMNQSDAYREAYDASKMTDKSTHDAASKLAAHPEVAQRIDVLKGKTEAAAVKAALLTREQSLAEAGLFLEQAQATGQVAAGVAAAKLRAQLSGHLSETKQDPKGALEDMDVERLLELRKAVEDKVARSREALELTGAAEAIEPPAPQLRRVI